MTTRRTNITEIAAEFHIPRSVALRYITEAGVKRAADKSFPYAAAAAAIRARKDVAKVIGNRTAGKAGGKLTPVDIEAETPSHAEEIDPLDCTPSKPAAPAGVDDIRHRRVEAQSRLDGERERKLRLQNDTAEGRLIDRDRVTATTVAIVTKARTALLSLGVRIAPLVVGEDDANAVAKTIDAEVRRVLGSLADEHEMVDEVLQ